MVCAIGTAWAGDVFEIKFQNSKSVIESPTGYFTYDKGAGTAVSWSSKGKHSCTYNGETYSDVIKMESSTQAYFTSSAKATVTIVQTTSNATGDKLKFDGSNLDANLANTTVTVDADNKCNIYVITDVEPGQHKITRQSETGLAYIKVEYTGAEMTQLDAPTITISSEDGTVTISGSTSATKITYTTDGTNPTADSEEYTTPFTVEDGVTVKAICIGDGETTMNSPVASELAILANATIAAPVIKHFNGTVAITCETAGTTIEYSLDGTNYDTYTRAFTLSEDGTVYARAKRGEKVSEVTSADITTISKGEATKTIWMGHGSFTDNDKNVMTGKEGDDAEGVVLAITGNTEKKWSSGGKSIKIGDVSRMAIKLSNGAQNTITLPDGMTATRITFYSFINDAVANGSYWKEFNGEDISGDVPMGATNSLSDPVTTPDVRVFPLDGTTSSITFTNAGQQLCFVIALDVIESAEPKINATSEIAVKAVPFNTTSTATIKVTGSNLENGTYDVTMPTVDGLSIEPTSFTVTDGAVDQTFTVTYNSDQDVESATANIVFTAGSASAETTVTYESRATLYELVEVSEATTWDWSVFDSKITITNSDTSTPTKSEEFVMKELEAQLTFGDFPAQSIVLKGERPVNKQAFQNGTLKIKTTVPGTIKVDFSDTGNSGDNPAKRYLVVNGQTTAYYTQRTGSSNDKKTGCEVAVPAGEVTITGTQAIMIYKLTFTPADAPAISVEITDAGYATFSSLFEVEIPSGVTAFYASASTDTSVTLTELEGNVIPAGTGVVLKGDPATYTMTVSNTAASFEGKNLLKANIADRTPIETEYYTLAAGPKFKKSTGGILAAGKAYLVLPSASARIDIVFDGEATGISEQKTTTEDNTVYNLNGIRVSQPTKGLYIKNGKKFVR